MTRLALLVCMCLAWPAAPQSPRPANPEELVKAMKRVRAWPAVSATFQEALGQYGRLLAAAVEVDWGALQDSGVGKTDRLAMDVRSATAEQMLDLILAQAAKKARPLAWYLDGLTIQVTTQLDVLHRNRLAVRSAPRRTDLRLAPARPVGIDLDFDAAPLEDVIAYFREISGLNMHVHWRSLELIGVDRQTQVTLKVAGVSLSRALTLVTEGLSVMPGRLQRVYWLTEGGVVIIASGEALNTELRTRIYDVADLLVVVPDFKAPEVALGSRDTAGEGAAAGLFAEAPEEEESPAARRQRLEENLIAAIKDSIGPDMWQPLGPGSIRLFDGKLIISQTPLGFKLLAESAGRR